MYNLIKFEMAKRKKLFTVLGILFLVAQVFSIYKSTNNNTIDSLAIMYLLSFISYVVFIFSSLSSFSKDMNSTDRSISFMVPKSGFIIISAKFLSTMILGIGLLIFSSILIFTNIYYLDPNTGINFISYLQSNPYIFVKTIIGIVTLGSFFGLVFLSIVVTKTFLSKLKFKTLITIVVMVVLSKIFNAVFWNHLNEFTTLNTGVSIIAIIFITIVMLFISGWLIDNKTDL